MPWSAIEDLNSLLSQSAGYQFGHTSDGYEPAGELWRSSHSLELTVLEAAKLCRHCHRLAPFLFLNGNTFASVAKIALEPALSEFAGAEMAIYRAAIGHYVAETIDEDELPPLLREADQ